MHLREHHLSSSLDFLFDFFRRRPESCGEPTLPCSCPARSHAENKTSPLKDGRSVAASWPAVTALVPADNLVEGSVLAQAESMMAAMQSQPVRSIQEMLYGVAWSNAPPITTHPE